MAGGGEKFGFTVVGFFCFLLGIAQPLLHLHPLFDFLTQLTVQLSQFLGAVFHPLLQMLIRLSERFGGTANFSNILNQNVKSLHFAVGVLFRYIIFDDVADFAVGSRIGNFKVDAAPTERPFDIGAPYQVS